MQSNATQQYLSTDEQYDVLVSLREVFHQVERISAGNIHCWKWAVIALASAINGSLTCNLSGSMQVGALSHKDAVQTISALQYKGTTELPNRSHLASPTELLKRARRQDKRIERAGPILQVNSRQAKSFKRLFDFRNAFLHFEPLGWTIETSGMSSIFIDVVQLVELTVSDGWSFRNLNDHDLADIQTILHELRRHLAEV